MSRKPVVLRAQADRDIREAIEHYRREADEDTALRFIDALETVYERISRHPEAGSPRYAHELDLPGLRTWPLNGFPFLVFYLPQAEHVDVWRVLHAQRDIPSWMNR